MIDIRRVHRCFAKASIDTVDHDGIEHAGYLAFLFMLAIFPFLFFMMALVSALGAADLYDYIIQALDNNDLDNFIGFFKQRISEIIAKPPNSIVTLAILSAVWTASSIFEAMRTILNRANRVKQPPSYFTRRLVSVLEFILIIFMTSAILFLFGVAPSIWDFLREFFEINIYIQILEEEGRFLREIILIIYGCFLVSFLYYFLPNKKTKFSDHLPGTLVVIIAWIIFTKLFNYYLSTFSQLSVIYGSIAGVIISLLFFYFCSIIFIFGAEFNYHLKKME